MKVDFVYHTLRLRSKIVDSLYKSYLELSSWNPALDVNIYPFLPMRLACFRVLLCFDYSVELVTPQMIITFSDGLRHRRCEQYNQSSFFLSRYKMRFKCQRFVFANTILESIFAFSVLSLLKKCILGGLARCKHSSSSCSLL
jgi:hypothetical protein